MAVASVARTRIAAIAAIIAPITRVNADAHARTPITVIRIAIIITIARPRVVDRAVMCVAAIIWLCVVTRIVIPAIIITAIVISAIIAAVIVTISIVILVVLAVIVIT